MYMQAQFLKCFKCFEITCREVFMSLDIYTRQNNYSKKLMKYFSLENYQKQNQYPVLTAAQSGKESKNHFAGIIDGIKILTHIDKHDGMNRIDYSRYFL